jgi:hypothetical protein
MSICVAILEDSSDRVEAMRRSLAEFLPGMECVVFEHSQRMIDWLGHHLGEVVLISLDHDLPLWTASGQAMDCGTGREVADYLASLAPTCPVIVHSSNDDCAAGMFFELERAGWPCRRVYPRDDVAWVGEAWSDEVRRFVRDGWIKP